MKTVNSYHSGPIKKMIIIYLPTVNSLSKIYYLLNCNRNSKLIYTPM